MPQPHRLRIEADNGDEVLLACPRPECGRRIVVKRAGGMVVLARGDFFALAPHRRLRAPQTPTPWQRSHHLRHQHDSPPSWPGCARAMN